MKLSTGKDVDANCSIFGIDEDGQLYGGYDERITGEGVSYYLTAKEKREVAIEIKRRAEVLIAQIDTGKVGDDIDD